MVAATAELVKLIELDEPAAFNAVVGAGDLAVARHGRILARP
jgi:hypothetical protein